MMELLDALHLTRQRNTVSICILLLFVLVGGSWWLFGLVWMSFLCAVSGLCYCATSYVCYHPEAHEWRNNITEWYERLFMRTFNYSHRPTTKHDPKFIPQQDSKSDHTPPAVHGDETGLGSAVNEAQGLSDGAEGETIQPMKMCHKEAQKMIQLIMKDFLMSWYSDVTSDTEFPEDIQKVLEHIALEVNVRLQHIDLEVAIVEVLGLILPYLEVLNKAGVRNFNGVELFDVTSEMCIKQFESDPRVVHPAMKSPTHEYRYYRQALDALIQCAYPPEYARCDVACTIVREILLKNIIEPLFNLLCDPGFLYEAIPVVLSKATQEKIDRQLVDIEWENNELEQKLNSGLRIASIKGSQRHMKRRFHTTSGRFGQANEFSTLPLELSVQKSPSSKPRSIANHPKMHMTSSGVYEPNAWQTQSTHVPNHHTNSEVELSTESTYPPLSRTNSRRSQFLSDGIPEMGHEEEYDHVVEGGFAVVELSPIYIERHVRVDPGTGVSHVAYIFKVSAMKLF